MSSSASPWPIAINVITFFTYGYDKAISPDNNATRVPEEVLLLLAFFGGTPGAIAGRILFRHKTKKPSFRQRFVLVVLLQILLVEVYFAWLKPMIGDDWRALF